MAAMFAGALVAAPAAAQLRIIDGDTIEFRDGSRMRLFGIDAAELGHPGVAEATSYLRAILSMRELECVLMQSDWRNKRDVGHCTARHIILGGSIDVSFEMIRAGHARVWCSFVRRERPKLLRPWLAAEAEARAAKRGIWARQLTPWRDYRCEE